MRGSSRAAAAGSREAFTGALAATASRSELAQELFGVVGVIDGNATQRRALADPSREGADKAALAERLFAGKVSAETLVVLGGVVGQRWSTERDLSDTLEAYGIETIIASAETAGREDRVERDDLRRVRYRHASRRFLHERARRARRIDRHGRDQPAPVVTSSPTICTAMTFTMVMDGKIIA